MVNKFDYRRVAMFGAVLAAFGFAISTLSPNIDVMMLTYGIIGGIPYVMTCFCSRSLKCQCQCQCQRRSQELLC